jgi:hypothetical protein
LPNDLLDGVQEVPLCSDLSPRPDGKHTRLDVSFIQYWLTSVATLFSSAPVAFGQSRAIRSYRISLSTDILVSARPTHCSPLPVDLEDVCSPFVIGQAELDLPI